MMPFTPAFPDAAIMNGGTDKLLIVLRLKSIFTAPALTGNVRGEEVTFETPFQVIIN